MSSPSQSNAVRVRTIKTYAVTPRLNGQVPREVHLSEWDIRLLSIGYIQKGLLFKNPPDLSIKQIVERLRSSLEEVLCHFYPLSGRLRAVMSETGGLTCHVEVGCKGGGAEFVHAKAEGIGIADVVAADGRDIPGFVKEFFPLHDQQLVNFDGCTNPLLAVQVTELVDGIFIGCDFNHSMGDGTSFWNFFNSWAEIARSKATRMEVELCRSPVHDKWFIGDYGEPPIKLPYSSPDEFIVRLAPPLLRERMFHFSSENLAKLKTRANQECENGTISTFQALSALMWRCITRARHIPPEQKTCCRMAIQNRSRLQPPLSQNYFGNSLYVKGTTITAIELLDNNLGQDAWLIHKMIANHNDSAIRDMMHKYMENPYVTNLLTSDVHSIMLTSSPRFDMYSCDFGWGKPVAARSGSANKFDGKVTTYPGWEGNGSIDLEVSLLPEYMYALERDEEFLAVFSPPVGLEVLLGTSEE